MNLKRLILNKGWAGRTLSRRETVERLNPILHRHHELNHAYSFAAGNVSDMALAAKFEAFLKIARTDVAKLSETVLSAGGTPFSGTSLEPDGVDLGSDDAEIVRRLSERESDIERLLTAELEKDHQIRTRAVLLAVRRNSRIRGEYLRSLKVRARRSNAAPRTKQYDEPRTGHA